MKTFPYGFIFPCETRDDHDDFYAGQQREFHKDLALRAQYGSAYGDDEEYYGLDEEEEGEEEAYHQDYGFNKRAIRSAFN